MKILTSIRLYVSTDSDSSVSELPRRARQSRSKATPSELDSLVGMIKTIATEMQTMKNQLVSKVRRPVLTIKSRSWLRNPHQGQNTEQQSKD